MTDRHAMSVLLPEDLYQWLRLEAFRQHTSMARIIAFALLAYKDTAREPL